MEAITNLLATDVYSHLYVIRGLVKNIGGFHLKVYKESSLEYLAI